MPPSLKDQHLDTETFAEAEIQLLIALVELVDPQETPNNNYYSFYPHNLEEAATYFRGFRTDWTDASVTLAAKGLLCPSEGNAPVLTPEGIALAQRIRAARPPNWYWYKDYYAAAPFSPAYAKFCELLYGKHLCQTNFSDMTQLQALLTVTALGPENRVLDLGCGIGMITEYIADSSGASVIGMDFVPDAIEQAIARTTTKGDRLHFSVGNLDQLPFPPHSFDTLVAIDTLYMPNDLESTLRQMSDLLQPGGQMAIFYTHMLWDASSPRQSLHADHTPLGEALTNVGLRFTTQDFSAATYEHLQRKRQIALPLQAEFNAENHAFLYDYILAESESNPATFNPTTSRMSRYLYHVKI